MTLIWLLTVSFILAALFPVKFKKPKIPEDKKAFYAEYMQSKEWKRKRRQRLKIDKYKCQGFHIFTQSKGLHVHHKNYDRLGDERMSDLITLCKKCHAKEHKK